MIRLILEIYAAVSVVATIAFVAWGLTSRRRANSDILETIKDFDQSVSDGHSAVKPRTAEMDSDAGGRSGPTPRLPNSPFPTRSKATRVT